VAKVSLAEEPLDVAVGCGPDAFTAEGGLFVAVATRIGPMTLGAVVAINQSTCSDGFRMCGQRIYARMILFGNPIPAGAGGSAEEQTEADGETNVAKEFLRSRNHRVPLLLLRNQLPT